LFFSHHAIITTAIFLFLAPKDNWYLFIPFFTGGVLIDFDHCFDYYLRYRKPTFSMKALSDGLADRHHYIIPFHSYEVMIIMISLVYFADSPYVAYLSAGYFLHIFLDIIFNQYDGAMSLSLIYRVKNWWNVVCSNTD
jgi:hypothetical protein